MFSFGIEHEVAFLNSQGKFADFSCTEFNDFQQIIDQLPTYPHDHLQLSMGDAGIRKKRWYIEGFERFSARGESITCIPKGIEIRTSINPSIQSTINELTTSFNLLREVAGNFGFFPVLISFNPYQDSYTPQPPLNPFELQQLQIHPDEQTAHIFMVSYGPDLNISLANLPPQKVIDLGQKFNYYSPYIVPFSYSSPFYQGKLWEGLSVRTFIRTGRRPATLVFVEQQEQMVQSVPSLTKIARIPAEIGRIEFKAFDSCDDFSIYAGLLAVLKGLALDKSLQGRAIIPDAKLHQVSAQFGFEDEAILAHSSKILEVVETTLENDPDRELLTPLKLMLVNKKTKSHSLVEQFKSLDSIEQTLKTTYCNLP